MLTKNLSIIGRNWNWYSRHLMEKYQLFGPDLMVLSFLGSCEQTTQDFICSVLLLDKATMAKSAFRLEELGHIIRRVNTKDRREKLLCLTETGRVICDEILEERKRWEKICTDGFSEEEIRIFMQLSERASYNAMEYRKRKETL